MSRALLAALAGSLALLSLAAPSARAAAPSERILVLLRLPPDHLRAGAGSYGGGYGDQRGATARRRIAERLARQHGLTLVEGWPMPLLGLDCFVMQAPAGRSAEAVAQEVARDPEVQWAEPSHRFHAQTAPATEAAGGDPLLPAQPAARLWRLDDLHAVSTGRNVRVAVIDSRVETTHPDLRGQVEFSRDFVEDGSEAAEAHGTAVAGVIAARAGNGLGISGVAPGARLMALRACWQEPSGPGHTAATVCDSLGLAKALHFAVERHAQVINLSLSGPDDLLLGKLIDVAVSRGATVVGAVDPHAAHGGFPADHPGVIAVAEDSVAGAPSHVYTAPGRDVPTTEPGGRWFLVNGSSYSAAHVSGLFALMRQRNPEARDARMLATIAPPGRIDACASLLRASGPCECDCAHAPRRTAQAR